ncbi:MbnP family protein [uncultured Polaribacter sp.]|uniref:MbnP family protein n=1 Tax=uncultured Polaribacter sp. TaxID=174711 RepID=UPI002635BFD2|nr:MbnP family protein [uncultured Polaribacter sp.]
MNNLKKYLFLSIISLAIISCEDDSIPVANNVTLAFNNTFGNTTIVLGDATSTEATQNTSSENQVHHFSEAKYIISNIRLINKDGIEFPYNVNNLDTGATIIDQSNPSTLQYVLNGIPSTEYTQIKFGLGVKAALNTLDQELFPAFYSADKKLHWFWATGYRFTKIEGFYGETNTPLSVHTGSVLGGDKTDETTWSSEAAHARNAYRDITLDLTTNAKVGENAPKINIKADFNKVLSGTNKITLNAATEGYVSGSAPSHHTSPETMVQFVDNMGGNGDTDITGMFSIESVEN